MAALVADTHSAIWFLRDDVRLSLKAAAAMNSAVEHGDHIYIPSISVVELIYLVEKGRVLRIALDMLRKALREPTFGFTVAPLDLAVTERMEAISRQDIPDLPDRVIAATAVNDGSALGYTR